MCCDIYRCEDSVVSCCRVSFGMRALALALLVTSALSAQALAIEWTNTAGVPDPWFHVGDNWAGGVAPDSSGTANFDQAATYEVWWDSTTSSTTPQVLFLDVLAGEVTFLNKDDGSQHSLNVYGTAHTTIGPNALSISSSDTILTNRGVYLSSYGGAEILDGATLTLDGCHAQGAQLHVMGANPFQVDGVFNVEAGALATDWTSYIGMTSTSTGEATVTGSGSQWHSLGMRVGNFGNGALNIEAGGVVSVPAGNIAFEPGSTGVVNVSGFGSQWIIQNDLRLENGSGTLNIEAGGVVNSHAGWVAIGPDSTSVVTVRGSGSQWNCSSFLELGRNGSATLNIESGGTVDNTYTNIGGGLFGGSGTATVTGVGSQWHLSQNLAVGRFSGGTLIIEAGGVVNNASGFVGSNSYDEPIHDSVGTGVTTVTGVGSQWNNVGNLYVGYGGHATLNIEAGGMISNTEGYVGYKAIPGAPDAIAVATVTGTGSHWENSESLYLGGSDLAAGGNGVLNVLDNGLVNASNTLKVWETGTLNLDGGVLLAETIDHTGGGTFDFLDGTLGVGTFEGHLIQNGGRLVIGNSPGITNVTGLYEQQGGSIQIEVLSNGGGSPIAGTDFDQLTADSAVLSGTLDLIVDAGYSPVLGDTFPIISAASGVSGVFGTVNNASLPGGLAFDVIYGTNDVSLEVVVVPEPETMILLLVGLVLPGFMLRHAGTSHMLS